jgi:hypothetical protein
MVAKNPLGLWLNTVKLEVTEDEANFTVKFFVIALCTIYHSDHQFQDDEMGGTCSTYWGDEKFIQNLGRTPEGTRPLEISRRRGKDNIKMDIKELGVMSMWTGFNWLRRRSSGGFL